MLGVFLTILKIIGIILLCILGLLLLAICLILFVPVRYKAKGYYKSKDDIELKANVSYLLHILNISISYTDKFDLVIRIFGFKLGLKKSKNMSDKSDNEASNNQISAVDDVQKPSVLPDVDTINASEQANEENDVEPEIVKCSDDFVKIDKPEASQKTKKQDSSGNDGKIGFLEKIAGIKDNIDYYLELIQKDSTKRAFETCKHRLGKLIRAFLPKKGTINVLIGMEDAGTTGTILGIYYALIGYIGKVVHIEADFDRKVIEADFKFKGRIFTIGILVQLLKLYFNKDCRRLIKIFKNRNN